VGTRLGNSIGGIVLLASFACPFPSSAQNAPLGVVQQANRAHLGQSAVTEGATIYAGEILSTEAGGALELRVASSRFGLLENSQASFYPRPKGPAAELSTGTLTFRRDAGGADIEVVASDVRIVPEGEGAVMGQVTIVSPCKITITSFLGPLHVTSGTETRTIKEKESYSVILEVSVLDVRAHISPDDPEYHQSHTHKACAARHTAHSGAPAAAGASRFLLIAVTTVGAATTIAVWEALESPDRP
jgi:hypothetical protein